MKKKYLLLACLGVINLFNGLSQVTIHYSDFISVGDSIVEYYDNSVDSSISVGEAGANLKWDFSLLNPEHNDTLCFVDPNETPMGNDFPNSNIALYTIAANKVWCFLNHSENNLIIEGVGFYIDSKPKIINNRRTLLQFPLNFNDKFTSKSKGDEEWSVDKLTGDTVVHQEYYEYISEVDAWGDLVFSEGIFFALRVKHLIIQKNYFAYP